MNNQNQPLVTIAGRLGKNPVQYTRNTKKGKLNVAKFSLAVTVLGNNGAETVWYQCSAWDSRCELVMKHLRKGDSVQLHGFARRSSYISKKNGQQQNVLEFNVVFVTFLGKAKANLTENNSVPAQQAVAQEALPGANINPF